MNLEYSVGKITFNGGSFAIKAHRRKQQNPAIRFNADGTVWTIIGLQAGSVDEGEEGDVDHLDLYVLIDDLCDQLSAMPLPSAASARRAGTTNPWGTERLGKKRIRPGRTRARLPVGTAEMRFAAGGLRSNSSGGPPPMFNIDFELAPYPNPDRSKSKMQVHFGVDAKWATARDRRIRNSQATIAMSPAQYAAIHNALTEICDE